LDLRLHGRGCYLCRATAIDCLRAARRRRSVARSLRVGDDVIDYDALGARLSEGVAEETPP
jgi:predicted RNA-binding protein YlxR (DUF448 family)